VDTIQTLKLRFFPRQREYSTFPASNFFTSFKLFIQTGKWPTHPWSYQKLERELWWPCMQMHLLLPIPACCLQTRGTFVSCFYSHGGGQCAWTQTKPNEAAMTPHLFMEKVHFWPFNYWLGLILAIELQNRVSSTIQLLKPFTIGHRAVLLSDFNFFIYNLVFRS
jgi:hypothetical protein